MIDTLRGFALCGIFFINITGFAAPDQLFNIGPDVGPIDRLVNSLLLLFIESKFFTLFSFLFGVGFAIQVMRAEAKGLPFVGLYLRRMGLLALFGVLHILLLWEGDILLLYALVGLLLLPFHKASPQTLRRWVLGLFGLTTGLGILGLLLTQFSPSATSIGSQMLNERIIAKLAGSADSVRLLSQYESLGAYLTERATAYAISIVIYASRVPTVLAMFLLGLLAGRNQILHDPGPHQGLLRGVRCWGLLLGSGVSLFATVANSIFPPVQAIAALSLNQYVSGPLQSMGMAAGLVLLVQDERWAKRLKPLAAYGRLSLTNYLTQSLMAVAFFYGFGLVNQVNLAAAMLIVAGLLGIQITGSNWWLRRFRFGPLEWLWRSLTYGSIQPIQSSAGEDR